MTLDNDTIARAHAAIAEYAADVDEVIVAYANGTRIKGVLFDVSPAEHKFTMLIQGEAGLAPARSSI